MNRKMKLEDSRTCMVHHQDPEQQVHPDGTNRAWSGYSMISSTCLWLRVKGVILSIHVTLAMLDSQEGHFISDNSPKGDMKAE
ncbi:hypothetical protein DUI87_25678 [Hirundo rustica rustica]|uniref:Uncharacterized protein n=1 Tax=Hirundo rustica rustica TaxID=333673 RepID=A0A3M0J9G0_HIRRU|nr:hypothetical protein DUI87_25678 [Hirundo rustica rustica]